MAGKTRIVRMLALALAAAALSACGSSDKSSTLKEEVEDRGELKLAIYQYQPFSGLDKGEWSGIFADITTEIADRMDVELETTVLTPTGYITSLAAGRIDAVVGVSKTDERAEVADFSTPILYAPDAIAIAAGSGITGLGDLDGKKVAVTRGAWSETLAGILVDSGKLNPGKLLKYETYEATLLEVSNGRADAAIADVIGVQYAISQNPDLNLQNIPIAPEDQGAETFDPMYYVVSKKVDTASLIEELNGHLEDMREDGTLEKIFAEYDLADFSDALLTGR